MGSSGSAEIKRFRTWGSSGASRTGTSGSKWRLRVPQDHQEHGMGEFVNEHQDPVEHQRSNWKFGPQDHGRDSEIQVEHQESR
jgi:hypothetical protein